MTLLRLLVLVSVSACAATADTKTVTLEGAKSSDADLTGAGSTFAAPLYAKWSDVYARAAGVRVNYAPTGSSAGIQGLSDQTVDFGGTDSPMSDAELQAAKGGAILHIPTALGAVVLSYNLAEVGAPLRLTGAVVSDMFRGKVTKWNDPSIVALNPRVSLPARDIVVVHRSDGSGTTYVFTDFLSQVSPDWAAGPGKGKDVAWPTGVGGKGNDGVASQIKATPGAIGYVELTYARQNSLPAALIQNGSGLFIDASVASINAAATTLAATFSATNDYRVSVVNAPGPDAYPIASFTWAIIYRDPANSEKGKRVVDFLRWGLTRGQQYEAALNYAPLPDAMVSRLLQRLDSVQVARK